MTKTQYINAHASVLNLNIFQIKNNNLILNQVILKVPCQMFQILRTQILLFRSVTRNSDCSLTMKERRMKNILNLLRRTYRRTDKGNLDVSDSSYNSLAISEVVVTS